MMRAMPRSLLYKSILFLFLLITVTATVSADNPDDVAAGGIASADLHLKTGVMCETVENFRPVNVSTVFSVRMGRVMCFTEFDHVPAQMEIYHDWIKRSELVFRKKLVLRPPQWSSVSSIQLREADKGPWRVEIRSASGQLIELLRFSITD